MSGTASRPRICCTSWPAWRSPGPGGSASAGVDLRSAQHGTLRRLVGYGARGMMLARDEHRARRLLPQRRDVGRRGRPAAGARRPRRARGRGCPAARGRMLTHGGEPLTIPERARLTLARALFATPALLVVRPPRRRPRARRAGHDARGAPGLPGGGGARQRRPVGGGDAHLGVAIPPSPGARRTRRAPALATRRRGAVPRRPRPQRAGMPAGVTDRQSETVP